MEEICSDELPFASKPMWTAASSSGCRGTVGGQCGPGPLTGIQAVKYLDTGICVVGGCVVGGSPVQWVSNQGSLQVVVDRRFGKTSQQGPHSSAD